MFPAKVAVFGSGFVYGGEDGFVFCELGPWCLLVSDQLD